MKKKLSDELQHSIECIGHSLGKHMGDYVAEEKRSMDDIITESYDIAGYTLSVVALQHATNTAIALNILDKQDRAKELAEIYLRRAIEKVKEMELIVGQVDNIDQVKEMLKDLPEEDAAKILKDIMKERPDKEGKVLHFQENKRSWED